MSAHARRPRFLVGTLLALLIVLSRPAQIESTYWWHSPRFIRALQLTAEQRAVIDRVYLETLPGRRQFADQAGAAHARLERLIALDTRDENVIKAAIDEEADAEAARRVLRSRMLYRMWLVLTPAQRSEFDAIAASQ